MRDNPPNPHPVIGRARRPISFMTIIGVIVSIGVAVGALAPAVAEAQPPSATIPDDFDVQSYDNNAAAWNGDWDESGDNDSATSGTIAITTGGALRFDNIDGDSIMRPVDLSPYASDDVVLTFDWTVDSSSNEELWVELRDDSNNWRRVVELDDDDRPALPYTVSYQLTSDLVWSGSAIRFRSTTADTSWDSDDEFEIDNVLFAVDTIRANADLPVSCGIDVTIVLDESGSIESADAVGDVENAVRSLVDGLKNTGSRLKFTEFSDNGRAANILGGVFQPVDDAYESAVETYLTTGGDAQNPNGYNPGFGEQWTNWEAGLAPAVADPGQLVVFITDGQPNTVDVLAPPASANGGALDGDEEAAAGAALDELDAIKATGAHVLAIGVGAASNNANFDLLTRTVEAGTAQTWEGSGDLDMATVDALRVTTFDALDNALREVVFALCAPSVSITKTNDVGAAIPDFAFDGTVDVLPLIGGADQFEWVSPSVGISPPAGATQQAVTDSSGVALFQWTPNTVAAPRAWESEFTFTETLDPGWSLATPLSQCTVRRLESNGDVSNLVADLVSSQVGQVVTFTLEVPNSSTTFLLTQSDIVTCDVQNDRPASITIVKDAQPNSAQSFDFAGSGGIGSFALDDDGAGSNSQTFAVPAGTYLISEDALPANWHLTGVTGDGCTPTQNASEISVTVAPTDVVTCTFTNVGTANLTIDKEWVVGQNGDTARLQSSGGYGGTEIDFTSTSTGTPLEVDSGAPTIEIPIGLGVDISEIVNPTANYTSALVCRDTVDGADVFTLGNVGADGRSGTVTAGNDAIGSTITCTFSNPRKVADVVVEKSLQPSADGGRFDLRVNGVTVVDDAGDGDSNAGSPVVVNIGDTVTVAEFAADGTPVSGNYTTFVSCQGPGLNSVGPTTTTFDVPPAAADATITCTFTNTRKSADLTVTKTWVDAATGDAVSITTSGGSNDIDFGSVADTPNESDLDPTTYSVFAGETLAFDEQFDVGNASNYTSVLTCDGAVDQNPADGLAITAADDSATIECTYTNTRKSASFTLDKVWGDADTGEVIDLTASGTDAALAGSIDTTATAPAGAAGTNTMTVYSGETVNFDEVFVVAANGANYTTSVACLDTQGQGVAFDADTDNRGGTLAVGSDPVDVTCTFTNSLKQAGVYVQKVWADGSKTGDEALLGASVRGGGVSDSDTSVAPTAPVINAADELLDNVVFVPAFAGDVVDFDEDLGAATANYDVAWACTDLAQTSGTGDTGSVTVSAADADAGDPIFCTITNTRRSVDLTVVKNWSSSPTTDGGAVALAIAGGDATPVAGADSNDGDDTNDSAATSVVYAGETLTLSEDFLGGDPATYTTTLTCTGGDLTYTGGLTGTLEVLPGDVDITCTFTNTRKSAELTLGKVWMGAYAGDSVDLQIGDVVGSGDGSSTAPASTSVATLTIYAGDDVRLAETFTTGTTARYATTLVCDGTGPLATTVSGQTTTGTYSVGTDPVAESCQFVNAGRADVSAEKRFVSATDADADGVYDVRYTVTVSNAGPGAEFYDLDDTAGFDADLTIVSASADVSGIVAIVADWAGGTWSLAADQPIAGAIDSNVPVQHVYTLDFVVDATGVIEGPGQYDPCDPTDPSGTGLFNSATLTVDGDATPTDDCGDIDPPDLDVTKTLTGITGPAADGSYVVIYDVAVANVGTATTQYTLVDEPAFSPGIVIEEASAVAAGGPADPADFVAAPWVLAGDPGTPAGDDQTIAAGATHTFTLTFLVDGSALIAETAVVVPCEAQPSAGEGLFNSATLAYAGETIDDSDCGDPEVPVVSIDKSFVSATDADFDGIYDVRYDVVVVNGASVDATYDLTDAPGFDGDLAIVGTPTATGSDGTDPIATGAYSSPEWALVSGQAIVAGATHTYELSFVVDATDLVEPSGDPLPALDPCGDQDPAAGQGLFNEATLTYAGLEKISDDCGDPLVPDLDITKAVTDVSGPDADGDYTVSYDVTVDNLGDGTGRYTLTDAPSFTPGVTIESGVATATGGPANPAAYASVPWSLAADQVIDPAAQHVYSLTFVIDGTALLDGSVALIPCGQTPQQGQGFFNAAELVYAGTAIDDSDCDDPEIPVVEISKTFGTATDADFDGVYDVTYTVTVANTSAVETTYTLVDEADFDDDLEIVSGAATATGGPADPAGLTVGTTWELAVDQTIAGNTTHTYVLSFVVDARSLIEPAGDPIPTLTECDPVAPEAGQALFNAATLSYAGQEKTADDCGEPNLPDLSIDKSIVSTVGPDAGGHYTVTYSIVVANAGDGATAYDLTDTPSFDADLSIVPTPVATATDGSAAIAVGGYSAPIWTLVDDQEIAAGATHTYTLEFVVDGGAVIADPDLLNECSATGVAGEGLFNSATLTYADEILDDDDCVTPGVPTLTVDKNVRDDQPVLIAGNAYSVTYDVVVQNVSNVDGAYTLTDLPTFGDGAIVDGIAVTGDGVDIADYTAGDPIVTDRDLAAGASDSFVIVVDFTVAADMVNDERVCSPDGGLEGEATYNAAVIAYNDGGRDESNDCAEIPAPDVTIAKVLDGAPTRDAGTGVWTVGYLLTVTSAATGGPATYDLSDEFAFGAGVTIVDGSVTATNTVPGDLSALVDFDGVAATSVVEGQAIEPGATHTFSVTVQATVAVGPATDGDCTGEPGEGTGFLNRMTIDVLGDDPDVTEACAGFATLTLVKDLVNDDGGNATLADFTLTADGPATLSGLSGSTAVSSAVPAGTYVLTETQVDGYLASDWVCVGATGDGSSVTVTDGANATCTITNDDEVVDLELTKDDGDFNAIAGGDPIPYRITVRNIGTRDADPGEPVTVTDILPIGLSWNSFPATCSAVGATLTCDIDPALLTAGAPAVIIDTLVDIAPDLSSGQVENLASVTTDDDPVCEGDGCTPPPCPAASNNNVDCDQTPIERFASVFITKTDDVADGDFVQPGEIYSYELVTGNLGPSTVLSDLVVDDDLPEQLSFVSIEANADWSCNSATPIECSWTGGATYPGEVLPAITVNVLVNDDAVGPTIDNTAIVTALVDDAPDLPSGLIEAHFGGVGDIVTASDDETTPMEALADLAIIKTASITTVGAGGGFDWVLDVTNNGPGTAVGVVVGDLVPADVVVTSVTSSDFACGHDGNDVECTVGSLDVGDSGRVVITVTVPAAAADGTVVNVGTVESDTPDPDLTNNTDEAEVVIVAQAPPSTVAPAPVTLPRTGSDATQDILRLAMSFLLLGGVVVLITRRRRDGVVQG